MRIAFFLLVTIPILFVSSKASAQEHSPKTTDTLVMDTLRHITLEQKLGMPKGFTIAQCDVIYSAKGEVYRSDYNSKSNKDDFWDFFYKKLTSSSLKEQGPKRGDLLLFREFIVIDQAGNRNKYPQKVFWLP